nr:MAG: cytochrome oxidase subunit III [Pseudomonadota bacterium]
MDQNALPRTSAPPRRLPVRLSSRRLGLYVFFASLTMFFAAGIVAYVITRSQSTNWRIETTPRSPAGLWLSTALVVSISAVLESARRAVRTNRPRTTVRYLAAGGALALAFLAAQAANWRDLAALELRSTSPSLFVFSFYLLTGLHAAHVVGGLVPLGIVLARTKRGEYSSSRHEGVSLCVEYWHFLAAIWVVLFAVLRLLD